MFYLCIFKQVQNDLFLYHYYFFFIIFFIIIIIITIIIIIIIIIIILLFCRFRLALQINCNIAYLFLIIHVNLTDIKHIYTYIHTLILD